MASILCRNGGHEHHHSSVTESKICYGLVRGSTATTAPVEKPVTQAQLDFIKDLGGDLAAARRLNRKQASHYIDDLKRRKAEAKVTVPTPTETVPEEVASTSKSEMVKGLITMVPDGYFAVREQEGAPITFLRVARPKGGNFKGALKISSQHGPNLEVRWALWPSNRVSVYRWMGHDIEDYLLLLIADWKGATMLYAEKAKKCGRCNTKLTDPRSRFYGIGPDCEQHWPWWLDEIAGKKGGYWEQQPLSVQEKYLPEFEESA